MRIAAKYISCIALLTAAAWSQGAPASAQDRLAKARQLYTQEGPKAALPEFEETLKTFRAEKDRHGEAVTLGYIANCYRKLEDLDKALQFAQQALQMKQELGDRDEIGKTYNQLGLIYWDKANYPAAIQQLQDAIEIASHVEDKELEGSARNNLGLVFDEQGEYQRSLDQYQQALKLHKATHFERGEGDTLGNIGGVYLLLGKFREALPYYQQAMAISERLGLKPALSDDLGNIALCLSGTGDVDNALTNFDRASEVAHAAGLTKEEADWHKGKGTTLAALGRFDAALREYTAAERVYEDAGLKRELVEALIDTGSVYELLGDGVSAESRFGRALQLARLIRNESGERSSLLALGDIESHRKQYDSAEAYFKQALDKARAVGDEKTIITALIQRATNNIEGKEYESALRSVSEANQVAERSGNRPALALSLYVLGELRRSQGRLDQAIEQYSAAQTIQELLRDPELGWRIIYGRGQAFAAQDKTDNAIGAYKEAIRTIEETRSAIAEDRYQAGYTEDRYQVYVALVELLLKTHKLSDAFFYSEKLRARAYFDRFGESVSASEDADTRQRILELAERIRTLRRAVQKEYSTPQNERRAHALELFSDELADAERDYEALLDNSDSSARKGSGPAEKLPSVADIQRLLSVDRALIEYVVGKQTLSIFVITPSSLVGVPVEIKSESLSSRTELLRSLIAERRPQWIEPARGLSKVLVDPLQSSGYLNSIHQLVVVPDGVLNYVPFAALPVGRSGFLGDEFTVVYLPAAAALVGDTKSGGGKTLLAMAPSDAHLPNTSLEVRDIGRMFSPNSRVVVGKAATKTLFKQIASNYDYVHLATHGSLNRNAPTLSAIELEPDRDNDGRLELYEIAGMKLHARLVTLSACETALGRGYFTETPGGDEFVGITRAFLSAGGQNVLASLWAVDDESTRRLMLRFYRYLSTMSAAEALAKAQQEMRRLEVSYRHPYYWAPFVIIGPPK